MTHSLKAIIFDLGQVLSYPERQSRVEEMARLCGLSFKSFKAAYQKYRREYDRGILQGIEYWSHISSESSKNLDSGVIETLITLDTANSVELNPVMLRWVDLLVRENFRTAILSNMTPDDMARMQQEDTLRRLGAFEVKVFSCWIGLVKPEKTIYHHCLRQLGLYPVKVLFIDDKEENIRAARDLGMKTYLFNPNCPDLSTLCRDFNLPLRD